MRAVLIRTGCLLAALTAGSASLWAQVPNDPSAPPDPDSINDVEAAAEMVAFSSFWGQWRRGIARQHVQALWRRFSPLADVPVAGGAVAAGGGAQVAGMSVSPVAGEGAAVQGWSLWLDALPAYLRNTSAALRGKGHTLTSTVGLDRQVQEGSVLGVSYSPSYSSATTTYNNGRERTWNHMVGLYLNQRIAPWLSLDVQGGYVHQRQKLRRQDTLGVYSGRRTSNGYHFSAALNASKWLNGQVMLSGRLGIVATRDRWRGYTENGPLGPTAVPGLKQTLVQGIAEAGVSWWVEPLMPYVKAAYNHDLYRRGYQGISDRDDFSLSGGVLWFGSGAAEGLSMNAGGTVVVGRSQQRHYLFNVGLKWAW